MEHYDDLVVKNNHKVLSPLEVKPGMNIYNVYQEHPFKVHNRWLVLKVIEDVPYKPKAFCVLLYGHRAHTPGETTTTIDLCGVPRSRWRMF